jgi:hypothetical protein
MKPLAQVRWITLRWVAAALFAGNPIALCQSTLPPTAPTMREIEEHPASVEYSGGQVAVLADNSSLSEIIRDVARRAGMAVKGDVVDERVFGTYGPAAPAEVLSDLLKGTGSNMMVVGGSSRAAAELILTPKQGGPTPPNPHVDVVAVAKADVDQQDRAAAKTSGADPDTVQVPVDSDKAGVEQKPESTDTEAVGSDAHPATKVDTATDGASVEHPAVTQ